MARFPHLPLFVAASLLAGGTGCGAKFSHGVKVHYFLYMAAVSQQTLGAFEINPSTGAFVRQTWSVTTQNTNPDKLEASRDGRFLWMAPIVNPPTVDTYALNPATGEPAFASSLNLGSGIVQEVRASVDQRFLFVSIPLVGIRTLRVLSDDGSLTASSLNPTIFFNSGSTIRGFGHPEGKYFFLNRAETAETYLYGVDAASGVTTFLQGYSGGGALFQGEGDYVLRSTSNVVYTYTIDRNTGGFVLAGSAGGLSAGARGIDPSGQYLWQATTGTGLVEVFRLDSHGVVQTPAVASVTVSSLGSAASIYFLPDGQTALIYDSTNKGLFSFRFDPTAGVLTFVQADLGVHGAGVGRFIVVKTTEPVS